MEKAQLSDPRVLALLASDEKWAVSAPHGTRRLAFQQDDQPEVVFSHHPETINTKTTLPPSLMDIAVSIWTQTFESRRACEECTKSHQKCSRAVPCQRCTRRGTECIYNYQSDGLVRPYQSHMDGSMTEILKSSHDVVIGWKKYEKTIEDSPSAREKAAAKRTPDSTVTSITKKKRSAAASQELSEEKVSLADTLLVDKEVNRDCVSAISVAPTAVSNNNTIKNNTPIVIITHRTLPVESETKISFSSIKNLHTMFTPPFNMALPPIPQIPLPPPPPQ